MHDADRLDRVGGILSERLCTSSGSNAVTPISRDEHRVETEIDCDVSPKRREVTGPRTSTPGLRATGVLTRAASHAAGSRGWIDHDGLMRLKYRPDTRDHLTSERPELRSSMSIVGRAIARRIRSGTLVGPGICKKWRPLRCDMALLYTAPHA